MNLVPVPDGPLGELVVEVGGEEVRPVPVLLRHDLALEPLEVELYDGVVEEALVRQTGVVLVGHRDGAAGRGELAQLGGHLWGGQGRK